MSDTYDAAILKITAEQRDMAIKLGEHGVLIGVLSANYASLRADTATKEHVELQISKVAQQLAGVAADLLPIKRGVYWAIALICGTVIVAIIGMVLKGHP